MATTKLNKTIRQQILREILHDRFKDRADELRVELKKLADNVYKDIFSADERELMESLPEGWLVEIDHISIKIDGVIERLRFDGSESLELRYDDRAQRRLRPSAVQRFFDEEQNVKRRMPAKFTRNVIAKIYDRHGRILDHYGELREALEAFNNRYYDAREQISTVLETATTINKLIELWPECEPWARKYEHPSNTLPAVRTGDLNELLGIGGHSKQDES